MAPATNGPQQITNRLVPLTEPVVVTAPDPAASRGRITVRTAIIALVVLAVLGAAGSAYVVATGSPTVQALTLGGNKYTVTIGPYSPAGPPSASNAGSIAAHVDVVPGDGVGVQPVNAE